MLCCTFTIKTFPNQDKVIKAKQNNKDDLKHPQEKKKKEVKCL